MKFNPSAVSGGGYNISGNSNYQIYIQATDAQSFSRMLSNKSSQEVIVSGVMSKIGHNAPIRGAVRRGR
jgi:hypothetical protein